jgi:hypothetical protein
MHPDAQKITPCIDGATLIDGDTRTGAEAMCEGGGKTPD